MKEAVARSLAAPGDFCSVCIAKRDTRILMLHWLTVHDAAQGTTQLLLCDKCEPVVRSFCELLNERCLRLSLHLVT
jgi:hypothetical protein